MVRKNWRSTSEISGIPRPNIEETTHSFFLTKQNKLRRPELFGTIFWPPVEADLLTNGSKQLVSNDNTAMWSMQGRFSPEPSIPYLIIPILSLSKCVITIACLFRYIVQFEREEGTLEQLDVALEKVNTQARRRAERPQKKDDSKKGKSGRHDKEVQQHGGDLRKRRNDNTNGQTSSPKKPRFVCKSLQTAVLGHSQLMWKPNRLSW